jgi:diaminopimelate decarboxylase
VGAEAAPWVSLGPERAQALAQAHGTPYYFYDLGVLLARVGVLRAAMPARVLYAVKANPHEGLLRALRGQVDGLDVASTGEVELALRCGWAADSLSFAGPGKTDDALAQAVRLGVLVSVESPRELAVLGEVAAALGVRARVRLRVNPRTPVHAYRVSMTGAPSPFGIDEEALPEALEVLRAHVAALAFDGLHVHPGGQCTSVGGFSTAAAVALDLVEALRREHGLATGRLNLGGGLGVLSPLEQLDVVAAGRRLGTMLQKFEAATRSRPEVVLEPGRWLVAPAGVYVARVVSQKVSRGTHFTVLDGGLNHHLAATGHLAGPGAPRLPLVNLSRPDAPLVTRTVVGPLCTPLDTLGVDVQLPEPRLGDLVGVLASGAYGYSFSPLKFLGHRPPAEVLSSPLP